MFGFFGWKRGWALCFGVGFYGGWLVDCFFFSSDYLCKPQFSSSVCITMSLGGISVTWFLGCWDKRASVSHSLFIWGIQLVGDGEE